MKRALITPLVLPPAALAELKQWLGISTPRDDALLSSLLRAAIDMCEAFTGIMPLEALAEEVLPATSDWQVLATRPVLAITQIEGIPAEGARFALGIDAYALDMEAGGTGRVRVTNQGAAGRIAVRFSAGLAPDWEALPDALRHGIIRLAAHQHRERENAGASPMPPAAVAALWRPWRHLRLT